MSIEALEARIAALEEENRALEARIALMGEEVQVHRGKRWEVWVGDCMRVLPLLDRASFGQVLTDPPYSHGGSFRADRLAPVNKKYERADKDTHLPEFHGDNKDGHSFGLWMTAWVRLIVPLLRKGGNLFCFMAGAQIPAVSYALQETGLVVKQQVGVWHKPFGQSRPNKGTFWGGNEFILHAQHGVSSELWGEEDPPCLPSLFDDAPVPIGERRHMSQKPVSLMERLILLPVGGNLLDPFGGSGSTGEAFLRYQEKKGGTGKVVLIEYMPDWADMIAERLAAIEEGRDWKAPPTQLSLLSGLS